MNALINITCFILVISTLHNLSRRYAERTCSHVNALNPVDAWIIYFVIFFSGLVISFHLVGTAALVTGSNFVHITTVTGMLVLLWGAERWIMGPIQQQKETLSCTIGLKQVFDAIRSVDRLVQWSAMVAGAIALLFLLEAATRPPAGWDALVYHLPLAIKWLQQESLAFIQESWKFQMPSNGNIFPLFLMYLGNEQILSLASLPFTLLAMLAVYGLAQRLSASREEALIAALGFGTMPIVLYHTFTVMVDMFAASFFLSSIYLLLVLFQQQTQAGEKRLPLAVIAGLAFGLGLGARYTYVPLLLFMTALCALVAIHSVAPLHTRKWKQAVLTVIAFDIGSLLTSIFWYMRNFMATGNPMYPLKFSMGDNGIHVSTSALSERARDAMSNNLGEHACIGSGDTNIQHWLVAPWIDCWAAGGDHYSLDWGLGAVFTTFIPVLMIAVVLLTIVTTVRRKQVQPLHLLLLVCIVFLTYWWTILPNITRSILPVIGIFFVFAAIIISVLSHNVKRTVYVLFLCAMITNGVLLAAKPFQALSSRLHHTTWSHSRYYDIPSMINELPAGSVILNAADERRNYPLYGRRWQNWVITDRALLEPMTVTMIDNSFIEQWGIEYIYYGANLNLTLADEVKREVLYEHIRDESTPEDNEILYRILR